MMRVVEPEPSKEALATVERIARENAPLQSVPATRFPGVGPRAAATFIDAFIGFLVIGLPLLFAFGKKTSTSGPNGSTTTYSSSNPKVLLLWVALAIVYYIVFEAAVAATPGKFAIGLRVKTTEGGKISLRQSAIRNVFRIVDAFPYFIPYLVAAIAVWNDGALSGASVPLRRRIGDRVAGTIVTHR